MWICDQSALVSGRLSLQLWNDSPAPETKQYEDARAVIRPFLLKCIQDQLGKQGALLELTNLLAAQTGAVGELRELAVRVEAAEAQRRHCLGTGTPLGPVEQQRAAHD